MKVTILTTGLKANKRHNSPENLVIQSFPREVFSVNISDMPKNVPLEPSALQLSETIGRSRRY
jgi:hypothetical protein